MKLEKWVPVGELVASVAVVVSLVFLMREVRVNTRAIERQAVLERAQAINAPFLTESAVPEILAKIKAVDGAEAMEQAFIERYGLSHEEASIWARYLGVIWTGIEADFLVRG